MDKQVFIGKVIEINAIEGADRIESLTVVCGQGGKWRGTAQKGQFQMGDLCEVYLQDSLLPAIERFAFMEKYHCRVRMMKFKGVPSEVLIMPLTSIPPSGDIIGMDITLVKNVTKYYKPIPASLEGVVYGNFPSFIPKTDEPNFQGVSYMVEALRGKPFYSTVKVDGSSGTIYRSGDYLGCCSRNMELKENVNNAIWKIAEKYNLKEKLFKEYAIQFEMIGEGIQKNPLGIKGIEARLFNIYNIEQQKYEDIATVERFSLNSGMPMVDIIDKGKTFDFKSDDELRKYAEGLYPNGRQREGVVIRPMIEQTIRRERLSFKIINLGYKN